jgi:hypothetical protein
MDVDVILKQLSTLQTTLGRADFDVLIVHESSRKRYFDNSYSQTAHFSRVESNNPYNMDFDESTKTHIKDNNRPVLWLSQCTQQNFLQAIETFRASIIGFANEELSQT